MAIEPEKTLELTYPAWRYAILGLALLLMSTATFGIGLAKIGGFFGFQASNVPEKASVFWLNATFQLLIGPVGLVLAVRVLAHARRGIKVALSPNYLTVSYLNGGRPIPWSWVSGVQSNQREIAFQVKGIPSTFPFDRSVGLSAREASAATIEMLFLSYWQRAREADGTRSG